MTAPDYVASVSLFPLAKEAPSTHDTLLFSDFVPVFDPWLAAPASLIVPTSPFGIRADVSASTFRADPPGHGVLG